MSEKYKIIQKDTVCSGLDKQEAYEALQQFKDTNPEIEYDIEQYKIETKRLGRDPDLH
mgnify:FL=1|tara:strand:- start:902 stop:1075 length:174 start_codon:yes stop_codon:yes gene_type:complete